ncbi:MAG: Na+/H+ antiporter, partial [Candidatus Limnocylindria bacterium]
PWPAAFALGAIVSPPDAVAATAVARRLGLPRRLIAILEGESLVNDATALVAYRAALAAAAAGSFSLGEAAVAFVVVVAGGIAVGLAVGRAVAALIPRLGDPPIEITVTLLAPFAAYLPAEALGLSGVLATVAAGLYVGWRSPRLMSSQTRLEGAAVWQMVVFLLNGVVFVLIGLQLPTVLRGLADRPLAGLVLLGAAVSLTVIAARIVPVAAAAFVSRAAGGPAAARLPERHAAILAWAGMRGVVSLAAALALPLDFPQRDLLVFLTFAVILATLVGQGLSLPHLIRALRVVDDGSIEQDEMHARREAAQAAAARIDGLGAEWPGHGELIDQLRAQYAHRAGHVAAPRDAPPAAEEQELLEHRLIRRAVIDAERDVIIELRDRGVINDEILRRVERDLDLEELRLEA